ncbi:ribonuclease HIII, partial [Candidatus Parcubacteria bacterium]|nr:ribonuclease HIII [Candidatus Parcubacteria bacterium]
WATYKIKEDNIDVVAEQIRKISNCHENECSELEYYHWIFAKNNTSVVVKQYKTGNLTVQGKHSDLFDEICTTIERSSSSNDNEIASRFIAQTEYENEKIRKNASRESLKAQLEVKKLLKESYDFLSDVDKNYFSSSQQLLNLIKDTGSVLPEYSTPIMAAGKGFEGFAIKLFISLGELDPDKIKKNPKSIQFNWKILENHLPNKQRDKYIIPKLLAEYNICRNFIVHSDPYRENELQNLNDARRMLETICETIKKAYKIFRPKIKQNQTPIESNSTTPILKKQKNECTVIESKNPIIGTDESGKGDYFGPLVCAGVYVDESTAKVLVACGVKDSKNLSDKRNREIAQKIAETCKGHYAIVEISPEKYNELYNQFRKESKNLNTLLAWGHARAIEDVLSKVDCEIAIADQFADERFIIGKLQERGKKIKLIQMHKAEQNIAVAAASILARARFLDKLSKLSNEYGFNLPKGASPKVIMCAKKFVKTHGKESLQKVAKMHFKTTNEVFKE